MPCYSPLQGWRSRSVTAAGRRQIVFNPSSGFRDLPVTVACGQCIGCRLERSRQWAVRCMHEASLYDDNCFITLTYSEDNLPSDYSVNVRHFQLFMKRLRKKYGSGVRYFHCGEYGDRFRRPHYHALLFNFNFRDRVLFRRGFDGTMDGAVYTSEDLACLWDCGFSTVGDVSFESASYVARYCTKKVTGDEDRVRDHYTYIDDSGEFFQVSPEYVTMSRRPGIGKGWFDKWQSDVFPSDFVVVRGHPSPVPKFYNSQYEITNPKDYNRILAERKVLTDSRKENGRWDRRLVREKVAKARLTNIKRSYEDGN